MKACCSILPLRWEESEKDRREGAGKDGGREDGREEEKREGGREKGTGEVLS